jgi:thiol-disulfide isomerase/thioredoxin/Flp pilus assembly protein TadD
MLKTTLLLLCLTMPSTAQTPADSPAVRIRTLYFMQDYDAASVEGRKLIAANPADEPLKAWTVLALSRNSKQPEAIEIADAMAKKRPSSMWSHFARAVALAYAPTEQQKDPEALAEAVLARKAGPNDPWAFWVHGYVLNNQRKYVEELAMIDSALARGIKSIDLENRGAMATMNSAAATAGQPADTNRINEGLAWFARNRAQAPDNFSATYQPAAWLASRRRTEEARPLLEKAAALAPYSTGVHSMLWSSIQSRKDLTEEQKAALILPDLDRLYAERGNSATILQTLRSQYQSLKAYDKMHMVEDRILREHPASEQEAWVYIERYRALSDSIGKKEITDTVGVNARLMKMMWAFIDRPTKITTGLADTYLTLLFYARSDSTIPAERLLKVAQGTAKYNDYNPGSTHSAGPIALADRGVYLKEAEAIARAGIANAEKYMSGRKSSYAAEGEFLNTSNYLQAIQHDAIGWVLFKQGRKAEALKELNRALEYQKESTSTLYHLGRIAEAEGDLAGAESYYGKGRGYETFGEKLNTKALTALYLKKNGSMNGFDAFTTALDEKDRDRRWARISEAREKEPMEMPAFNLEGVDGKRINSADLKGKYVVVNLWGVWCGPCVAETPELQKLYERLKADPDVVFVTIANDPNPQTTKDFMVKRKFTFPALLDDGFVAKVGNTAFPTTWFVDRDGKIMYKARGASDVVLEEFLWRLDLLRGVKERRPVIQ